MDEFNRALELMAEAVDQMNVNRRDRDLIRAGMKCACEYALMRRAGYKLSSAAKARQADESKVN